MSSVPSNIDVVLNSTAEPETRRKALREFLEGSPSTGEVNELLNFIVDNPKDELFNDFVEIMTGTLGRIVCVLISSEGLNDRLLSDDLPEELKMGIFLNIVQYWHPLNAFNILTTLELPQELHTKMLLAVLELIQEQGKKLSQI